jgi:outer membrane protein assembly factor BamB
MKRLLSFPWLLAVSACTLLAGTAAWADNWPQWRGPADDGICTEKNIPAQWSETKNLAWTLPLPGMGSSTPAVWGDRIFLTCAEGADLDLLCIATDGKEVWKRKVGSGARMVRNDEGNSASASPCTDGAHVFACFMTGDFVCFDFAGNEVWRFNAQMRYGKFNTYHGFHTTPVLEGDRLYMMYLTSGGHWVVALDKATGKDIWKIKRESDARVENEHSYASPFIWRQGKDAYLVVHGNDYTTAHRLSDGEEIRRLADLNPAPGKSYNSYLRFVASPVATPELIVVPTAKNGPVVALKPDARGLIKAGSEHEQWRRAKGTPDVPSPLVVDGLVYLCGEMGTLTCVDAKTGKEHYVQPVHRGRHRASPVYADGKIYVTARDGVVNVLRAGPKYELIASNKLPDEFTASPAIANGRIYLRGFHNLYAIGAER